jgi:hypothetical protein
MPKTYYKSMRSGFKSQHGDINWKIGEWRHQDGKIKTCNNGFHASENIIDAMYFVDCEILAEVWAKVVISEIQNAVSIAGLLLITEFLSVNDNL